ncbi:phosphatase PAP2 family protein [Methylomonas methanica]|uniref:undecaprenyl-diphosphate phosphatase n=1 Tax=Methylomonas methanica (strain DSM 25384 / MC09) TaxID=857087 RepID=G0A3F1_METMM|nr:phosphatase PAP2 family protein [Methylomonas methanica]AEG00250.1 phosphoesterase PA-phosphatase related protein [Methylomonas methanica MC09]
MKLMYSIHQYDVWMFSRLNNSAIHASLVRLCRLLSWSGDGVLYLTLAGCLYWQHGIANLLLQAMLLGFAVERPVYFVLKNAFKRDRPQQAILNFRSVITPSDKFSFPSGHTSAAFLVATLVSYFFPELTIVLYAWAVLVGFSRIVLGVHFPTDTLMGVVLGVSVAVFSLNNIL